MKLPSRSFRRVLQMSGIAVVFLLVFGNVVSSQLISPLYIRLLNDGKEHAVLFLKKIRKLPEFERFLTVNKNIYGAEIEREVFADEVARNHMIQQLEDILKRNPNARDALYNLSLLFKEEGNREKASLYLKQAKEIDPFVED